MNATTEATLDDDEHVRNKLVGAAQARGTAKANMILGPTLLALGAVGGITFQSAGLSADPGWHSWAVPAAAVAAVAVGGYLLVSGFFSMRRNARGRGA